MNKKVRRQFLFTIIVIFLLQALMLTIILSSLYRNSVRDIKDLGISNLQSQASMVENYLGKGGDVLWFAAGMADRLLENHEDNDEILGYLTVATTRMQQQFDDNFTGIYGYINGEYLDGSGWVPPEGYDPTERDWYKEAIAANGKMNLSPPYVDAQTGEIVVSYTQMLSDGKSVIALDIVLNEVQNITEHMTLGDKGYGFIVDDEGLLISHYDKSHVGKNYSSNTEWKKLLANIYSGESNEFETVLSGEKCTVFTEPISTAGWHVVIITNNAKLYSELRSRIVTGIVLSIIIYVIIVIFSLISVKMITKAESARQESLERVKRMNMSIIRSLVSTIDAKDRYTSGHSQRVADYAVRLAQKMGKSEEEQKIVYDAGLLHDVGKVRVPEDVINKPGKLTDEEFDQIKVHPVSGYHILGDINEDERIGYGAKYHHERYDGKGYPNGLKGEDIPEVARIIAVADSYDAMASDRSYRKALPQDVVRAEIEKGKGTQFDPEIAGHMLEIIDSDPDYELRQKEERTHNILIIDDDDDTVEQVKDILKDMEHIRVFGSHTEKEAFDMLNGNDFALIILDFKLKEIDGFSLYKHIREKYKIPVILMTADRSLQTVRLINELKIDDYLTKPLNAAITREAVHGILHRN